MQAVRKLFQPILSLKHTYMNPHEDFGRANICRAALFTYIGVYFATKWNSARKAKALEDEKVREKKNVVADALARAGLA